MHFYNNKNNNVASSETSSTQLLFDEAAFLLKRHDERHAVLGLGCHEKHRQFRGKGLKSVYSVL